MTWLATKLSSSHKKQSQKSFDILMDRFGWELRRVYTKSEIFLRYIL